MKPLTLENYKELLPYLEIANYKEYNSNIVTLLMWNNLYHMYFETTDTYALICSKDEKGILWLAPHCKKEYRKDAMEAMMRISKEQHIPFSICALVKEFRDWILEEYPLQFMIENVIDAQDYIYDRFQQESLAGKKMQKRRNHYRAFLSTYEHRMQYKPIEESDHEAIYAFLKKWQERKKEQEFDSIQAEEKGMKLLLSNYEKLSLRGGCIYIDGQLEAFLIASYLSKDTIQIHIEKANSEIRGLYVAILKHFLETLESDVLYINREEDMGLEELRKAKTNMHPIYKVKKFTAHQSSLQLQQANDTWLPQIKQLWIEQFKEESEESCEYYFQNLYKKENCWILHSKDELLCMLQVRKMKISLENKGYTAVLFFGIATSSKHEGCGYMRLLLNHVLSLFPDHIQLIQAYNWDLYRSFGFHEQYTRYTWKLDKNAYVKCNGAWNTNPVNKDLLSAYQNFTSNKNGYRIREEQWYEEQKAYMSLWDYTFLSYEENGVCKGYFLSKETDNEIHISECVYDSMETLHSMLAHFHLEQRKVLLDMDSTVSLHGKMKQDIYMMVRDSLSVSFQEPLYIREEI